MLGGGGFGSVYAGTWNIANKTVKVALKCDKFQIGVLDIYFKNEVDLMEAEQFSSEFVVQFLGAPTIKSVRYLSLISQFLFSLFNLLFIFISNELDTS